MEIYLRLSKGYFLTEVPDLDSKSKIELGPNAKKHLQEKQVAKGLKVALLGEGSNLSAKVGDSVLVEPNGILGELKLSTSEGDKLFYLFNDSAVIGVLLNIHSTVIENGENIHFAKENGIHFSDSVVIKAEDN